MLCRQLSCLLLLLCAGQRSGSLQMCWLHVLLLRRMLLRLSCCWLLVLLVCLVKLHLLRWRWRLLFHHLLRSWVQPLWWLIRRGRRLLGDSCPAGQAACLLQHCAAQGCSAQRACRRGKFNGRPRCRLLARGWAAIAS
jgi:hypothetical protein